MRAVTMAIATAALVGLGTAPALAAVGFTSTTLSEGGNANAFAVGDLDGRNGPDIVVADFNPEKLDVYLNNGDGTFAAPRTFDSGCATVPNEIHLGDVMTAGGSDTSTDGNLDVVVLCEDNGGDSKFFERLAGDGAGNLGAPVGSPLSPGGFVINNAPGTFALFHVLPSPRPVAPVWVSQATESAPGGGVQTYYDLCLSYDWSNATCLDHSGNYPSIAQPLVATDFTGEGVDEVMARGGAQGIAVFGGQSGTFTAATRDYGAAPPAGDSDAFYQGGLAVGDLDGDGRPDILSWTGVDGSTPGETPLGEVNVLYNGSGGVLDVPARTFPSQTGVFAVGTGEFTGDTAPDLIGEATGFTAPSTATESLFVQAGDGSGGIGAPQVFQTTTTDIERRRPIVVADLNGDGRMDAVAMVAGNPEVLINTVPAPPPAPVIPPGGVGTLVGPPGQAKVSPLKGLTGLVSSATTSTSGALLVGQASNPPTKSVLLTVILPSGHARAAAAKAKPKTKPKPKPKAKPVVLATATITIPAGAKRSLALKLTASARARLRHSHTLHARLTLVATGTDGTKATTTRTLTIKLKTKAKHKAKAKPKHHHA
jgi:hypothetical protein